MHHMTFPMHLPLSPCEHILLVLAFQFSRWYKQVVLKMKITLQHTHPEKNNGGRTFTFHFLDFFSSACMTCGTWNVSYQI